MQGYDNEKALAYIQKSIDRKVFSAIGPLVDSILRQAQALDLRYMREAGVLDAEGWAGAGDYDEDDAIDYIVEEIVKLRGLDDEQAVLAARVVDAYMGAQEAFLKKEGLAEE
ncbi:hypothetical protein FACS1894196_4910 [Clostridia bacterium]|nr:hypothetical protein FACS1894196_4910 [Clostridia bacterium]